MPFLDFDAMGGFFDREERQFESWQQVYQRFGHKEIAEGGEIYVVPAAEQIAKLLGQRLKELLFVGQPLPVYLELGAGSTSDGVKEFLRVAVTEKPDEAIHIILSVCAKIGIHRL